MEKNYDFRKRLLEVHRKNRRDTALMPEPGECCLDGKTEIVMPADADRVLRRAALDLQDYLAVSMGIGVRVRLTDNISAAVSVGSGNIVLATRAHLPERILPDGNGPRGFSIDAGANVVITGFDSAGAMQGGFFLEDLMNIRQVPFLKRGTLARRPKFSPRMVHSGFGLDQYPDEHLAAIAHAGMDAILVFVKGTDIAASGYLDFNDLCWRAAQYGLDVYAYSYLVSDMHPDDPGAPDYYDRIYGSVFAACPALRGIVLVGESVEFPSRDPLTTGKSYKQPSADGLPDPRPSPGWWPCSDYPQWLGLVRDSVRRYRPDADIVFWTYNWGYVEEKYRLALLDSLPTDISLLVTFEMFEKIRTGPVTSTCVDYTLMFAGPGGYFLSEARKARERGIRLYAMVNTGGLTWDIGVIPYEPAPGQWMERHLKILECREKYGLCGLMESHHYGFWPSFISDLAKWDFLEGSPPPKETLRLLAERDFGPAGANRALQAWEIWSRGIRHYLSTNEDQYGPFRIGPAYPLVFNRDVRIPAAPYALFGSGICQNRYKPQDQGRCSLLAFRLPVEMEYLTVMRDCFAEGAEILAGILPALPERQKENAGRLVNLGRFISRCAQTTIHVKQWYQLRQDLLAADSAESVIRLSEEMRAVAAAEIANAELTIPLVQQDSRLGWEPSMEYLGDEAHLRWKIKQVRQVIEAELPMYQLSLKYNFNEEEGEVL
ncbi:MAG TPA: hypothetical protein DD640_07900 [Clostridiales bacterium]|nr:hypothetical protein [Clostridiales bacterium]